MSMPSSSMSSGSASHAFEHESGLATKGMCGQAVLTKLRAKPGNYNKRTQRGFLKRKKKGKATRIPGELKPINTLFVTEGEYLAAKATSEETTDREDPASSQDSLPSPSYIAQFDPKTAAMPFVPENDVEAKRPSSSTPKHSNKHFDFEELSWDYQRDEFSELGCVQGYEDDIFDDGSDQDDEDDTDFYLRNKSASPRSSPRRIKTAQSPRLGVVPKKVELLTPVSEVECDDSSIDGVPSSISSKENHPSKSAPSPVVAIRMGPTSTGDIDDIHNSHHTAISTVSPLDTSHEDETEEGDLSTLRAMLLRQQQTLRQLEAKNQAYREKLSASHTRVKQIWSNQLQSKDAILKLKFERESFEAEAVWLREELKNMRENASKRKDFEDDEAAAFIDELEGRPKIAKSEVRWARTGKFLQTLSPLATQNDNISLVEEPASPAYSYASSTQQFSVETTSNLLNAVSPREGAVDHPDESEFERNLRGAHNALKARSRGVTPASQFPDTLSVNSMPVQSRSRGVAPATQFPDSLSVNSMPVQSRSRGVAPASQFPDTLSVTSMPVHPRSRGAAPASQFPDTLSVTSMPLQSRSGGVAPASQFPDTLSVTSMPLQSRHQGVAPAFQFTDTISVNSMPIVKVTDMSSSVETSLVCEYDFEVDVRAKREALKQKLNSPAGSAKDKEKILVSSVSKDVEAAEKLDFARSLKERRDAMKSKVNVATVPQNEEEQISVVTMWGDAEAVQQTESKSLTTQDFTATQTERVNSVSSDEEAAEQSEFALQLREIRKKIESKQSDPSKEDFHVAKTVVHSDQSQNFQSSPVDSSVSQEECSSSLASNERDINRSTNTVSPYDVASFSEKDPLPPVNVAKIKNSYQSQNLKSSPVDSSISQEDSPSPASNERDINRSTNAVTPYDVASLSEKQSLPSVNIAKIKNFYQSQNVQSAPVGSSISQEEDSPCSALNDRDINRSTNTLSTYDTTSLSEKQSLPPTPMLRFSMEESTPPVSPSKRSPIKGARSTSPSMRSTRFFPPDSPTASQQSFESGGQRHNSAPNASSASGTRPSSPTKQPRFFSNVAMMQREIPPSPVPSETKSVVSPGATQKEPGERVTPQYFWEIPSPQQEEFPLSPSRKLEISPPTTTQDAGESGESEYHHEPMPQKQAQAKVTVQGVDQPGSHSRGKSSQNSPCREGRSTSSVSSKNSSTSKTSQSVNTSRSTSSRKGSKSSKKESSKLSSQSSKEEAEESANTSSKNSNSDSTNETRDNINDRQSGSTEKAYQVPWPESIETSSNSPQEQSHSSKNADRRVDASGSLSPRKRRQQRRRPQSPSTWKQATGADEPTGSSSSESNKPRSESAKASSPKVDTAPKIASPNKETQDNTIVRSNKPSTAPTRKTLVPQNLDRGNIKNSSTPQKPRPTVRFHESITKGQEPDWHAIPYLSGNTPITMNPQVPRRERPPPESVMDKALADDVSETQSMHGESVASSVSRSTTVSKKIAAVPHHDSSDWQAELAKMRGIGMRGSTTRDNRYNTPTRTPPSPEVLDPVSPRTRYMVAAHKKYLTTPSSAAQVPSPRAANDRQYDLVSKTRSIDSTQTNKQYDFVSKTRSIDSTPSFASLGSSESREEMYRMWEAEARKKGKSRSDLAKQFNKTKVQASSPTMTFPEANAEMRWARSQRHMFERVKQEVAATSSQDSRRDQHSLDRSRASRMDLDAPDRAGSSQREQRFIDESESRTSPQRGLDGSRSRTSPRKGLDGSGSSRTSPRKGLDGSGSSRRDLDGSGSSRREQRSLLGKDTSMEHLQRRADKVRMELIKATLEASEYEEGRDDWNSSARDDAIHRGGHVAESRESSPRSPKKLSRSSTRSGYKEATAKTFRLDTR